MDATGPRIRSAEPADAARIRALQSHLRQPSPDLLEYGLVAGAVLVSVADEERFTGDGGTDGTPAGTETPASSEPVVGYLLRVDAPNRRGSHLAELVVDPAFRREGRARELLSATLRDATGPVTLQAHPANDAALSLYDSLGFDVIDRRTDAYADADALVLRHE